MTRLYEVRMSPDGVAAVRNPEATCDPLKPWLITDNAPGSDADVADWTPYMPMRSTRRYDVEQLARDEFSMVWESSRMTCGDLDKALRHVVGVLMFGEPLAVEQAAVSVAADSKEV